LADSPSSCIPRLHFTLNMLGLVVIAGDEEHGGRVDAFYGLKFLESKLYRSLKQRDFFKSTFKRIPY
jgi:hypothetical protein